MGGARRSYSWRVPPKKIHAFILIGAWDQAGHLDISFQNIRISSLHPPSLTPSIKIVRALVITRAGLPCHLGLAL